MAHSHFVINLVIRKDNKILLEKRNDSGSNWKFPGGHVESGENIFEACKREALEELGVDIKFFSEELLPADVEEKVLFFPNPQRTYIENKSRDSGYDGPHSHTSFVYFVLTENEPIEKEKQIIKWFSFDDLKKEENILDEVKNLAVKALKTETNFVR